MEAETHENWYGFQFAVTQMKGTQQLGSNGDRIANFSVGAGFLTDDLDRLLVPVRPPPKAVRRPH